MKRLLALCLAALMLGGCASVTSIDSDVVAYSHWPADRKPGSFVFERLPSQQAEPARQQQLEDWARPAIAGAGFVAAASHADADVTIQLGARISVTEASPFADPFWWGGWGPHGYWRSPYWGWGRPGWGAWGPWGWSGWGPPPAASSYEREAALLIRDRRSGDALYQARASSAGLSPQLELAMPAMFAAALRDFPHGNGAPRMISIEPAAAAAPPAAAASR